MSELILNVPIKQKPSNWIKFINNARKISFQDITEVTINFSNAAFVKPAELVLISCLIEEYTTKNKIKVFFVNVCIFKKL